MGMAFSDFLSSDIAIKVVPVNVKVMLFIVHNVTSHHSHYVG
jgi:hypothetical protein